MTGSGSCQQATHNGHIGVDRAADSEKHARHRRKSRTTISASHTGLTRVNSPWPFLSLKTQSLQGSCLRFSEFTPSPAPQGWLTSTATTQQSNCVQGRASESRASNRRSDRRACLTLSPLVITGQTTARKIIQWPHGAQYAVVAPDNATIDSRVCESRRSALAAWGCSCTASLSALAVHSAGESSCAAQAQQVAIDSESELPTRKPQAARELAGPRRSGDSEQPELGRPPATMSHWHCQWQLSQLEDLRQPDRPGGWSHGVSGPQAPSQLAASVL